MRSILMGLAVCVAVVFAAPAFGEAAEKGKEKAAEPAKEAVQKQTPAVKAGPPAKAEKATRASTSAPAEPEKKANE